MNYDELKKIVDTNSDAYKRIYLCNFWTFKAKRMKIARISLVKNLLGKYVVTLWLDYEYGKFLKQETFKDKDAAANYAWQLFNNLK